MDRSTPIDAGIAALRMMDFFVDRCRALLAKGLMRRDGLDKAMRLREMVAMYPGIPRPAPDLSVSMLFNHVDLEYGGARWDVRTVRIRDGRLELRQGRGLTDGMTGSDVSDDPAADLNEWLAAMRTPAASMRGPYL